MRGGGDVPAGREAKAMAAKIETRFLSIPADEAALRDFLARAERDLAGGEGSSSAGYPAFRADLERAAALVRAELARAEAGR